MKNDIYACYFCGRLSRELINPCFSCGGEVYGPIDLYDTHYRYIVFCRCGNNLLAGEDFCPNCGAQTEPIQCIHRMCKESLTSPPSAEPH